MKNIKIFLFSICVLFPLQAGAYNIQSERTSPLYPYNGFENGEWDYYININSFSNLGGYSYNSSRIVFWVAYALSRWSVRTGIDFDFEYKGDTTRSCQSVDDGYSVISVVPSCADPECNVVARVRSVTQNGYKVESDLCIYGGSANFETSLEDIDSTEKDLIGVLVHELGHVLGMDHTNNTAMQPNTYMRGNGNSRYITGDDIDGLLAHYDKINVSQRKNYRKWRQKTTSSWTNPYVFKNAYYHEGTDGTIGENSNGDDKVISTVSFRNYFYNGNSPPTKYTYVVHTQTDYPLTSSSSWTNYNWSGDTLYSPSATSIKSAGNEMLSAWASTTQFQNACQNIETLVSNTAFSSGTRASISTCTLQKPNVDYITDHDLYVMVYSEFDFVSSGPSNTGEIKVRTSSNGINWSSETSTGLYTIESPDIACKYNGECLLSFASGESANPYLYNNILNVSSSGVVSLGFASLEYDYTYNSESILYRGGSYEWFSLWKRCVGTWPTCLSEGDGYTYYREDNSRPMNSTFVSPSPSEISKGMTNIVGNDNYSNQYIFIVD